MPSIALWTALIKATINNYIDSPSAAVLFNENTVKIHFLESNATISDFDQFNLKNDFVPG